MMTPATVRQEIFDARFRSRVGRAFAEGLVVDHLRVRPMRRRPGSRHVFCCELLVTDQRTGTQSSIQLVGKRDTTRAAGKAAREFDALRQLWDAGFGADEHFGIPWPVQHFSDLLLILQMKASGSKLRTYVGKDNQASVGHARMAGRWLAKLHSLRVSPPQTCTYENEMASLRLFTAALCTDVSELASEMQQRASAAEQSFISFQRVPASMVHGDFHPDHIFVKRDRVTVIDFERFCISDPARDLGSFIAHTRTMASLCGRPQHATDREVKAFLESYLAAMPFSEGPAFIQRVAAYMLLSSLEALYYVASVLKVVDPRRLAMYLECIRESEYRAFEFTASALRAQSALKEAARSGSITDDGAEY